MASPDEYVDQEYGSARKVVEIAADAVSKGVHSGNILPNAPMTGSYYHRNVDDSILLGDNTITAVAATTIAEFADFLTLPSDHILYKIQRRSHSEQTIPDEADKISQYTTERGILFHKFVSSKIEYDEIGPIARQKFSMDQNEWPTFWRAVARYHNAPQVNPPGFYTDHRCFIADLSKLLKNAQDPEDAVIQGIKHEIKIAKEIFKQSWGQEEGYQAPTEVPFVSEISGCRFGGRIDRISVINESKTLPEGVFAVDLKFTESIRPEHIFQVEAYRRVFESHASIKSPIEGAIVRIDIFEGDAEILTTLDDKWPSDAWSLFHRTYDRWYDKFDTADLHLQRSSEGM
ncbi:hypothetical protein [Halorubrum distributum]|uniref:hypothetical protein n=1 Tax=Halorubrum distributum TaxID=29283 RepID=UPI00126845FD|nr:hypothetical protein [Halorubrum arcis]